MKRITYHACVKSKCTLALTPRLYKMKSAKCRRENNFFFQKGNFAFMCIRYCFKQKAIFYLLFAVVSERFLMHKHSNKYASGCVFELSPFLQGRDLLWKDEQRVKMAYREHLFCFSLSPSCYMRRQAAVCTSVVQLRFQTLVFRRVEILHERLEFLHIRLGEAHVKSTTERFVLLNLFSSCPSYI